MFGNKMDVWKQDGHIWKQEGCLETKKDVWKQKRKFGNKKDIWKQDECNIPLLPFHCQEYYMRLEYCFPLWGKAMAHLFNVM